MSKLYFSRTRTIVFGLFWILASGLASAADSLHRPPSFFLEEDHLAVFIDIVSLKTQIEISTEQKKAVVTAHLVFKTDIDGFPVFDLTQNPGRVWLDGEEISTREAVDPHATTVFRVFTKSVTAGLHEAHFHYELKKEVKFSSAGVEVGFWMNDLEDRGFLEQYLPANLEYDAFPLSMTIVLDQELTDYSIFANGRRSDLEHNSFRIDFPSHFNSSSFFFHLVPTAIVQMEEQVFEDLNGRRFPVIVYSKGRLLNLGSYMQRALSTLSELQIDYGVFPHPHLIVYASPSFGGGMEHAGATITSLQALAHEITHSYFGRALMPANGNAGWMDEALASWRDRGYPTLKSPGYSRGNLAAFSDYRRSTPDAAYTRGRNFMAYLDYRLQEISGDKNLKSFLKLFLIERSFKPLLTPEFQKALEAYAGISFEDDFDRYIYSDEAENFTDQEDDANPVDESETDEADSVDSDEDATELF